MKACKGLRNLYESSFYIQGWVDKGWEGKGRGRVGHSTKPEAKTGDGEKLGLTVDLSKLLTSLVGSGTTRLSRASPESTS